MEVRLRPAVEELLRDYARRTGLSPEEVVARAVHAFLAKRKGRLDP